MDTLENYRQIIRNVLTGQTTIPYAHEDIQLETIFDSETDRYAVLLLGRDQGRRVHGCLIHIDIIDRKIWIQRDGTEQGVANDLVEACISKEHIVLGFRLPEMRHYTEFAIA